MAKKKEFNPQSLYDIAKSAMDSIDCLKKNSDKVRVLEKSAKDFESLGDFQDARTMAEDCRKLSAIYKEKPDVLPPPPKNPIDEKPESKAPKIIFRVAAVVIILAIIAIFFVKMTDSGKYLRANFNEHIGNHQKAYKLYKNIKGYKDSNSRYLKNRYLYGCETLDKKKYEKARDTFRDIATYKDSGDKLATAEIEILKSTPLHEDILFGEAHWIVVEKTDDRAFLVKTKPTSGVPYNSEDKPVTWKTSSIRSYLNTTYAYETFTPAMINKMIDTKIKIKGNKKKHIKGCKTTDKIFMLNPEQSYKYSADLSIYMRDWWLITPGESQNKAQFVSYGQVMPEGYNVNNRYINMRPCFWLRTN